MLAADQVIGSMVEISGTHKQSHDVGFTVGHVDLPGLRQLPGALGHSLVSFDPALAFLDVMTLAIGGLGLSGPHPRIHHAQRLAGRADSVGRMQIHTALCLVAQWTKAPGRSAIEVQLGPPLAG